MKMVLVSTTRGDKQIDIFLTLLAWGRSSEASLFRLTQKSFFVYTFSFPLYFFFPVPEAQTQHLANVRHALHH